MEKTRWKKKPRPLPVPGHADSFSPTGAAALSSEISARDLPQILTRRDSTGGSSSGFDSVNLNVPADGVTMTFVETNDDDDA